MHSLYKGLCLLGLIVFATCTPTTQNPKCQSTSPEKAKEAERALADFAVNLYKNASTEQQQEDKNQAISPISIALALAMLENGANGQTRNRLQQQLLERQGATDEVIEVYRALEKQLQSQQQKNRLEIANAIFHDKQARLKQEYQESSRQCLDADVKQVDIQQDQEQARQQINQHIRAKTNNKITELVKRDQLKRNTKVVLANAIHMKASWEHAFNKQETKKAPFYRHGREGDRQEVNMMQTNGQYRHTSDNQMQVLELPYDEQELNMYILLPKQRDGLKEVERRLNGDQLRQIIDRLQRKQVQVQLPKFGIRDRTDLKRTLSRMGLEQIFNDQADLSRMSDERLKVDEAQHEAYIQVDEQGTEASAATHVNTENRSTFVTKDNEQFVAEHPFIYTIVHKRTGAVVFIGKVSEVQERADE